MSKETRNSGAIITGKTRLLGVAGWPVEHSKSPLLQNAALRAAGLDFVYLPFSIPPERFETAVRGLAAAGLAGLNCTVPHKHAALALCDAVSEVARRVGAVNTLRFGAGGIAGDNTDVEGYVESLRRDGEFDFQGRSVVQLGAGGAGRAMAFGALQAGAARLTLVNRTREKAESLAEELRAVFPGAEIAALSSISREEPLRAALGEADLVANATSLGLSDADPFPCEANAIAPRALVFDAVYTAARSTAWLRAAAQGGRRTLDGMGMLARQGAASFRIWTGVEADVEAMFAALK